MVRDLSSFRHRCTLSTPSSSLELLCERGEQLRLQHHETPQLLANRRKHIDSGLHRRRERTFAMGFVTARRTDSILVGVVGRPFPAE